MRNFNRLLAVVTVGILSAPAAMASSILVDDFITPGSVLANLQGNAATGAFAGPGIIGGERYMWVSTDSTTADFGTGFEAEVVSGDVSFTNGSNITGQAVLVYDGLGTGAATQNFSFQSVPGGTPGFPNDTTAAIPVNITGLSGVDLLSTGTIDTRSFAFEVGSFEALADVDFRAYAWDMSGNVATYFENLFNPGPDNIVTFDTSLRLSEFTFGGAFDWSSIGALAFSVESLNPEFDGTIGSISVVPLPASALLLLGGLGGLAGMSAAKRRRRKIA